MRAVFLLSAWSLTAYVVYRLISYSVLRHRRAKATKALGCNPAPTFPNRDPAGIRDVIKIIQANNAGKLTDLISERMEIVSKQEGRTCFTFQTHVLWNWLFFTGDPKNIQAMVATQFRDFELGPVRTGLAAPLLGQGIFSSDGKQWEHARSLVRPQFSREQVSDLDLEERHFQNMMMALPANSDGWTDFVNIQPLFFRLTIDSASEFLLGESPNSQLAALPGDEGGARKSRKEDDLFVAAFERCQQFMARAFLFNDWFRLALTKEFYDACDVCHRYTGRFIQKVLSNEERQLGPGKNAKYVFLEALATQTQDPIEIRDQVLSLLFAGRDTTASLLSFLFLVLSQNQHVFQKLRQIIIKDFGTYKKPKNITFSSIKACSYLQWCINETLRLYPTVPLNSRRCVADTTLPRGGGADGLSPVFIPKGTEVNFCVYVAHRSKDLWGEDADVFKPERWNGRKSGFEYLPFGGGPRVCLGQQFALTEAGYVTVRLLQKFDKIDGSAMAELPIHWTITVTGRPKYGVNVRLHEANED